MSKKAPALEQLEELREQVRGAEAKVQELDTERLKVARSVERATEPLESYWRDVGAGRRKPDAKLEQQLRDDLRAAEDGVTVRPIPSGTSIRVEIIDPALEARLAGAREAVTERENAVATFIAEHRDELVAELIPKSKAARDRLLSAVDELNQAEGEWNATRRQWSGFVERWSISPSEIPPSPLQGASGEIARAMAPQAGGEPRDARRFLPMPASLAPGDGPEVDTDGVTAHKPRAASGLEVGAS